MKRLCGIKFETGSFWTALFFFLLCASMNAQDRAQNPYLIPLEVYAGDRAILVVPLPEIFGAGDVSLDSAPEALLSSPDIDLYRVVLEKRPSGSRLLVEFSAFATGPVELPPIEIGGERFTGLRVEIRSVIGPDGALLSPPAAPLAIPGTGLLVYGGMAALALLLVFALWILLWGRRHLNGWVSAWRRRRLIVSMRSIEKRLRRRLLKEGGCREILDVLLAEFRSFLSFFSGENCRAMTSAELGSLRLLYPAASAQALSPAFLGSFFCRCDRLRFSGSSIGNADVLAAFSDLRFFLAALEKAGREKNESGEKAA